MNMQNAKEEINSTVALGKEILVIREKVVISTLFLGKFSTFYSMIGGATETPFEEATRAQVEMMSLMFDFKKKIVLGKMNADNAAEILHQKTLALGELFETCATSVLNKLPEDRAKERERIEQIRTEIISKRPAGYVVSNLAAPAPGSGKVC